ncbi:MAG: hypothetical protein IT342_18615 [Candidatus Melainabacteria bacterium]|nr:hypothetical protein [Candidatus Melainabacteria bacterium]
MSLNELETENERKQLERLFNQCGQAEPQSLPRLDSTKQEGRWQPYILGAACTMFIVGFWNILQPIKDHSVTQPLIGPDLQAQAALNSLSAEKAGLTGILDNRTLTASYYWTVVLKNDSATRQEAVARMQLPEGAVVSRATDWVNGIPQEAAFNSVAATARAYDTVVAEKREPLLVTDAGAGMVEIKAFPVEPAGGKMKIRIGITAPLRLSDEGETSIEAPYLVSSNFGANIEEELHIEGDSQMRTTLGYGNIESVDKNGKQILGAHVTQTELDSLEIISAVASEHLEFATRATHSPKGHYIHVRMKRNADGHSFSPQLIRTSTKPNVPIVNDEDAAFRLSSLWASQEIGRLIKEGRRATAEKMGSVFRLVTPVSSAAVFESARDYARFGLNRNRYAVMSEQTAQVADSQAPMLQGATNGAVGPQGSDATIITGVNTAGTFRPPGFFATYFFPSSPDANMFDPPADDVIFQHFVHCLSAIVCVAGLLLAIFTFANQRGCKWASLKGFKRRPVNGV